MNEMEGGGTFIIDQRGNHDNVPKFRIGAWGSRETRS